MGGYNHLLAILDLIREAALDKRVTYVHIISGQDIIVKGYQEFNTFFSGCNYIYMTCNNLNNAGIEVAKRVERYSLFSNLDSRKKLTKIINGITYAFQKSIFGDRTRLGEFNDIYKGMIWASMPIAVVNYIIQYSNDYPSFMKSLKHTLIPEEFFFQTILMNSPYKNRIVNDNLRYTDWTERNGSIPAYLDISDYLKIENSGAFFARKVDESISKELIELVSQKISDSKNNY